MNRYDAPVWKAATLVIGGAMLLATAMILLWSARAGVRFLVHQFEAADERRDWVVATLLTALGIVAWLAVAAAWAGALVLFVG
jgi:hypothetical protein